MRRLIGFICMALMLSATGLAGAHDGTKVIYDLSELGREILPDASTVNGIEKANWTSPALTVVPNSSSSASELDIQWTAGDLELTHKRGNRRAPRGSNQVPSPGGQEGFANATPNPEPGTLILMGSGLLAGARSLRRRKNR